MDNFSYLEKIIKKEELVKLIMDQVQDECGILMFSQWRKLYKKLHRENRVVLRSLIIRSKRKNTFMADEIKNELKFEFDY